jgi:hypothetical protein
MQFRIGSGIVVWSIIAASVVLTGCATSGGSGAQTTFMEKCTANAKTEQERSDCAWQNADRMASGR